MSSPGTHVAGWLPQIDRAAEKKTWTSAHGGRSASWDGLRPRQAPSEVPDNSLRFQAARKRPGKAAILVSRCSLGFRAIPRQLWDKPGTCGFDSHKAAIRRALRHP